MIERTEQQELIESLAVIAGVFVLICLYVLSTGAIVWTTEPPAPVQPVNITPIPTETIITPEPTPAAIPTLEVQYIDPYASGERSENQWYKFWRANVQGEKDLEVGLIAYRHRFLDRYTWWNPSTGNYFTQRPSPGFRYFAVWVHEEMFGINQSDDPSFWAFDQNAFALQVKDSVITSENNITYNPVIRIKEFDDYTDYYDVVTAPAFGYYVRYTGHNPESGGFRAEKIGVLRMGQGNAHDGFILYEIPKDTMLRDIRFLGEFGSFGSASWTFPEK